MQKRKEQDECDALQARGVSLRLSARAHLPVPAPSSALWHPRADRTHHPPRRRTALPSALARPSRPEPRARSCQKLAPRAALTLQPEPGGGVGASGARGPGVGVQVRVSGRGGARGLGRARVPAEPARARAGGVHFRFSGDPVHQHHRGR